MKELEQGEEEKKKRMANSRRVNHIPTLLSPNKERVLGSSSTQVHKLALWKQKGEAGCAKKRVGWHTNTEPHAGVKSSTGSGSINTFLL